MKPGVSIARRERLADGWLFHGSEVLVGEETLSCTFSVVVGADWVTRRVEVAAVSAAGETRRVLEAVDGRWTVDGAPRPDLDGCVDVDIAATPLTNTFPIRRLAHLAVGEPADVRSRLGRRPRARRHPGRPDLRAPR